MTGSRVWAERAAYVLSPLVLLMIWQIAADQGAIDVRFFPAPSKIGATMMELIANGQIATHVSISLTRIAVGYVLGVVPAVLIGLVMGLVPAVRAVLQPIVDTTFPIPKIAILPLLILLVGIGEASKYLIIAISVFYLVLINTVAGVRNIDKIYIDVAKSYGASNTMWLFDVALPAALPTIMAGLKVGMGIALLVIVSAEFVGARSGIGYLIWSSWQIFEVSVMYVGLLLTAIIGMFLALAMEMLERVLVPWKPR